MRRSRRFSSGAGNGVLLRLWLAGLLSLLVLTSPAVWAADIQLRRECRARGGVVVLGDVAEVIAADSQQAARLAAIELFPAPPAGRQRYVPLREISEILVLREVNLAEHRLWGASQVTVLGPSEPSRTAEPRSLTPSALKKAEREASHAIEDYLRRQASSAEAWVVEVDLEPAAARVMAGAAGRISVRGGTAPWIGRQRFELDVASPEGLQTFPVNARVSVPGTVVVAVHALPRGTVIQAQDVQLQRAAPGEDASACFRSAGEVVGQTTLRDVPEGRALDRSCVRPPLAIRRAEVITVYARGPGIRVRTTARAREDGSLGDLITVESLADRKAFTARVCGIQEAEVPLPLSNAAPAVAGPPRTTSGPAVADRRSPVRQAAYHTNQRSADGLLPANRP